MDNWLAREVKILRNPPAFVVPRRYEATTEGNLPPALAEVCADYITHFWTHAPFGRAPLLLGRAFTWKTATAAVLCRRINQEHRVRITWVSVPDRMIQLELDRFSPTTRQVLERWKAAEFLVLDDFSSVEPKTFGHEILKSIMAYRFDNLRPTLWTGNVALDPKDPFTGLSLAYGPLMGRRWQDAAKGFTVIV